MGMDILISPKAKTKLGYPWGKKIIIEQRQGTCSNPNSISSSQFFWPKSHN